MNIESFTKLLQLSISPIAVISGAGLLLLSITNRLGRAIDRSRDVSEEIEKDGGDNAAAREQLLVLVKRATLLRNSVFFMAFSVFLATLMILALFLRLFMGWSSEGLVLVCLFASVGCLCVSMILFLWDVSLALGALRVEVAKHLKTQ